VFRPGTLPGQHILERALPKKGRKNKETAKPVQISRLNLLHVQGTSQDVFIS
jgi:hypothetical protein